MNHPSSGALPLSRVTNGSIIFLLLLSTTTPAKILSVASFVCHIPKGLESKRGYNLLQLSMPHSSEMLGEDDISGTSSLTSGNNGFIFSNNYLNQLEVDDSPLPISSDDLDNNDAVYSSNNSFQDIKDSDTESSSFLGKSSSDNLMSQIGEDSLIEGPSTKFHPNDIPRLLMQALEQNDYPYENRGLELLWNFSAEGIHSLYDDLEEFIMKSHALAKAAPASFYGMALKGSDCSFIYHPLNRVGGENGWIATQIMTGTCPDGRSRNFQIRLIKQRRPPNLNCWVIEGLTGSDHDGTFRLE